MPRDVQEPTETQGRDRATVYNHPAFGQIVANRVSGRATLYGSDFEHNGFVVVTISRSELHRNLARDWHHADEELIRVAMSEAQWVTMVSSMNMGSGVPCTIEHVQREQMPGIPHRDEAQAFKSEAGERVERAIEKLRAMRAAAKTKAAAAEIDQVIMELTSNLDFVEESFGRHVEERMEKAKVEIGAYMTGMITRAGLDALRGVEPPLALEATEAEREDEG